ncbi:hypothetical protein [Burkholderia gladioli]|uniref:hypothetical protein n=1 Tax=Burkholderia gladioli TaxID=28095 RepID=UPI0016408D8F|nr:hypothetical protein [Burkholderia gladioli]
MNHLEQRYAPQDRVNHVMQRTGCTQQAAIAELVAEEGSTEDAVLNLNAAKAERGDDPRLLPRAGWQTRARGTNDQEYQIYVANAEALGWQVKTYDQWLAS